MKGRKILKLSDKHTVYEYFILFSSGIQLQDSSGMTDKKWSMGPLEEFVGCKITLEIEEININIYH